MHPDEEANVEVHKLLTSCGDINALSVESNLKSLFSM